MNILRAGPQLVFTFDNRFSSTGWAVPQSVRSGTELSASKRVTSLLPVTQAESRARSNVYVWNNLFQTWTSFMVSLRAGIRRCRRAVERPSTTCSPGGRKALKVCTKIKGRCFLGLCYADFIFSCVARVRNARISLVYKLFCELEVYF